VGEEILKNRGKKGISLSEGVRQKRSREQAVRGQKRESLDQGRGKTSFLLPKGNRASQNKGSTVLPISTEKGKGAIKLFYTYQDQQAEKVIPS